MSSIPKIIHQTWKTTAIPAAFITMQASWRRLHPDWEYRLWTDQTIDAFIQREYAWFYPVFKGYDEQIARIDAWRIFVLHHYGGVYADLDFEALRPIGRLLHDVTFLAGKEPTLHANKLYDLEEITCNAFLAAVAKHPFLEHFAQYLTQIAMDDEIKGAVAKAGPLALTQALNNYSGNDVNLVDPDVLYPLIDIGNRDLFDNQLVHNHALREFLKTKFSNHTYAVHWWAGTHYNKTLGLRQLYYKHQ